MGSGANSLLDFPRKRRSQLRWDSCLPCTIRNQGDFWEGMILDVSQDGAFIQADPAPETGSPVEVSVQTADQFFLLQAEVMHRRSFESAEGEVEGFGVRFTTRPPSELLHRLRHAQIEDRNAKTRTVEFQSPARSRLEWLLELNKEIWLILSLVLVSGAANLLLESNEMVLGFYSFPTVFSAYFFGRRHATLTALGSVLSVILLAHLGAFRLGADQWLNVAVWGGTLLITGYAMGTLYERMQGHIAELRETYHGVLVILQHFIAKDKYTQSHSHRVSIYAGKIASRMGLDEAHIEDVRVAALLHDIGKLDISRDILYKASRLTEGEYEEIKGHVDRGISMLRPVGGSLRRVLPIILAHHDRFDGTGYHPSQGEEIPLAARIIAVADVYDAVTSDRPYRKAMSPLDARDMILKGSGADFDPRVVEAFLLTFRMGEMDISEALI